MRAPAELDFLAAAPRPWYGIALAAGGALALALTAAACWTVDRSNADARLAGAAQLQRLRPPAPRTLSESDRVRRMLAERVSIELTAPWGDLLATIEEHGNDDIGLLKVEPDARAETVRITGQARDTKSIFAYLHAFEQDPRLSDVMLNSQKSERETPGEPRRFTITASWHRPGMTARNGR